MTSEKTPGQQSPAHSLRSSGRFVQLTRRSMLGLTGIAVAGATVGAWPQLTGPDDIPGAEATRFKHRHLGTAADAAGRQGLIKPSAAHPDIPCNCRPFRVRRTGRNFFSKILTIAVARRDAPGGLCRHRRRALRRQAGRRASGWLCSPGCRGDERLLRRRSSEPAGSLPCTREACASSHCGLERCEHVPEHHHLRPGRARPTKGRLDEGRPAPPCGPAGAAVPTSPRTTGPAFWRVVP